MAPTSPRLDDLLALRAAGLRRLPAFSTRRPAAAGAGAHLAPGAGRGMHFAESRPYLPGDDRRSIDWRVTARTGRPHTKCFESEREQPVWLLIDQSPSMQFGSRRCFKSVAAAHAAAWLAWTAVAGGDRVGALLFGGGSVQRLPPRGRDAGALALIGALVDSPLPPEAVPRQALPDLLADFSRQLAGGARVVVLSDFQQLSLDPAQPAHCRDALAALAGRAELALVQIFDPLEAEPPPPGRYPVRLADGVAWRDFGDEALRAAWRLQFFERNATLDRFAGEHRLRHLHIATDQSVPAVLADAWGGR